MELFPILGFSLSRFIFLGFLDFLDFYLVFGADFEELATRGSLATVEQSLR